VKKTPSEILHEGCKFLDPVMNAQGFSFREGPSGKSSGGLYASGVYVNGPRELEIHYRFSLGLVKYHFGAACMDHESYMRAVLDDKGGNKYPGFSDDPLAAFRDLAYDLQNFARAFLDGDSKQFALHVVAADEWKKISGIARLP
jgi:hypothetical protein